VFCGRHDPERARLKAVDLAETRLKAARARVGRVEREPDAVVAAARAGARREVESVEAELARLHAAAPRER
jgi:hypothetical protein